MRLAVFCALALASCARPEPSAVKDVATNARAKYRTHFYYLDGNDLVRAGCGDEIIHDRNTCVRGPVLRTLAAKVFDPEQAATRVSLAYWEKTVGDMRVVIARNEALLFEQIAAAPAAGGFEDLRRAMVALEHQDALALNKLGELDTQLKLLQAQLQSSDDVEARLQLAVTGGKRDDAARERAKTAAALAAVHEEYIQRAGASISDATFRGLSTQRAEWGQKLKEAQRQLDLALDRAASLQRVIGMIARAGVTVDVSLESAAFAAEKKTLAALEADVDKLHPDESREEFQRYVGWLIIDWSGDWTCLGHSTFFPGDTYKLKLSSFESHYDPGDKERMTSVDLFATGTYGTPERPVTFAQTYKCSIDAAFMVDCEAELTGALAGRIYLAFMGRDLLTSGMQLKEGGETKNAVGLCKKGAEKPDFDD